MANPILDFSKYNLAELKDSALDASTCGIVITDYQLEDNPIIYANKAFESMTGYSQEDTIGRNCRFLQGDAHDQAELEIIRESVKNGKSCQVVLKNFRKNGQLFWNELFIAPLHDGQGQITNYIGVQTDVTKRIKAEQSLVKRTKDLEQSNKDLEQFAYAASHDLQEPLRMISTFLEMLNDQYQDKLDPKAAEYIDHSVDGAKRMQNLIRDLLELSRAGSSKVEQETLYLDEIVQEAISNLKVQITETKAQINYSHLPTIKAVKSQMILLVQNLISNSIKYCKGNPVIDLSVDDIGNHWLFVVKDNGIGINPEFSDYIFEVFNRLHSRKDYEGTGIGLAICRKIVEKHQGEIWFANNTDQGTSFKFTIAK